MISKNQNKRKDKYYFTDLISQLHFLTLYEKVAFNRRPVCLLSLDALEPPYYFCMIFFFIIIDTKVKGNNANQCTMTDKINIIS